MTRHPLGPVYCMMACVLAAAAQPSQPAVTDAPYASPSALPLPQVFAPGVISTGEYESHPQFTRDGLTLYFLKNSPNFTYWTIVFSRFAGGRWSDPEVASFSGQYSDADPFITADGSRLYFISDRPAPGKATRDLDIWMAAREGEGWGDPTHLEAPIASPGSEWFPTVAADGTLYFGSSRAGGLGLTDIYRARLVGGRYAEPENLGAAINTTSDEYECFIAPDQRYMLVMASGRPDELGGGDLYVSENRSGTWTPLKNLGAPINSPAFEVSPTVSPDGRYFFFTSTRERTGRAARRLNYEELRQQLNSPGNGLGDIYQVDMTALRVGAGGGR